MVEETQQLSEALFGGRGAHFVDVLRICFLPCVAALRERPYQSTAVLVPCRPIRGAWQPATLSPCHVTFPWTLVKLRVQMSPSSTCILRLLLLTGGELAGSFFFFGARFKPLFSCFFSATVGLEGKPLQKKTARKPGPTSFG